LRAIPLFASLKDDELAYIGSIVKQTTYPANEVVITQGEQGETFYIIAAGQVRVRRHDEFGAEAVIRLLGPGQFIGEVGLLYGEPTNATVETAVPTTFLYIEEDDFDAMIARLSSVRKQLEETASRRSKATGLARFGWQMPDEIVLWLAQRNIVPLMFESIGGLLFWHFVAAMLAVVSFTGLPGIKELPIAWPWGPRLAAVVIVSLVWVWYVYDWTNDYLVLTSQRIVHVERYGLLSEMREEVPIPAVQNVVLSRAGVVDALLQLADLTIETIGGKLMFTHISGAQFLQERILDQRAQLSQEARREERDAIRQELVKVLKPESLAVPQPPPPSPDALAALARLKPKPPPQTSLRERLRTLRQMRVEKGDEITWRKHWLILLWRLSGPTLLGLGSIALSVGLWRLPQMFPRLPTFSIWAIVTPLLLILPALAWGWWRFLVWGGDIYILTANRIIDIERLPLGLRETRRESHLDRIQDIDVEIPNIVARIYNMGDVYIKTGAAGSDLRFHTVADPYGVQRDIFHRLAEFRRKEQEQRRRQTMEEMTKWLTVYNELTTRTQKQSEAGEGQSG
jgi:hypothetical protein